ncbi:MAG TPA: ATPase domain-containing protein [Thermoplasmata archaeon]|nr:ATPase domain-containing protein [Thermoplasmata archaeon]
MIKQKVKTGVPGIDEMLDGGLISGRTYVVSGTSGTGKTTLAMQFLLEGVKNAERVMYVALDEPPNEIKRNTESYGWNIGRVLVFDATPDVMSYDKTPVRDVSTERRVQYFDEIGPEIRITSERSPVDMTINTLQELLKQEMKVRSYSRIVIDSLSSLRYFYIRTSEENASLVSFIRILSDLGITSLMTLQLSEISRPDIEVQMARGEIRLHKWFDGRGLMRGVTIEKYRGSSHDHRMRQMKITNAGIVVKTPIPSKGDADVDGDDQGADSAVENTMPVRVPEPKADQSPPQQAAVPDPGTVTKGGDGQ